MLTVISNILSVSLAFVIPIGMFVYSIISVKSYIFAKRQNTQCPGTFPDEEIKRRKSVMIASALMFGVPAVIICGFIILMFIAAAHM